jgi:hypothetical protein
MTEVEDFVGDPGIDCGAEIIEFAGEEVIGGFHNNEVVFARQGRNKRLDLFDVPVFVVAAMHEQFGLVALAQK